MLRLARVAGVLAVGLIAAPAIHGQATPRTLPPANATFAQFAASIQKYMSLRAGVEAKLPKVSETSDAKKIAERAALLAAGLQAARKDAKAGDIFTLAVATEFRKVLAADAAARSPADRASLMAEVPQKTPQVNALYPLDSAAGPAALPSFPAKLLAVLPELPEPVEYRFLGKALVLRDTLANIIIDFLPDIASAKDAGRFSGTHR
jgi:hypothetical protein